MRDKKLMDDRILNSKNTQTCVFSAFTEMNEIINFKIYSFHSVKKMLFVMPLRDILFGGKPYD